VTASSPSEGLLLIVGCASHHVFVNPTRNAAEQQEDLADCTVKAEKQPLRYPNPKRPSGVERRAQLATFVEDCMIAKGYQSQTVRK